MVEFGLNINNREPLITDEYTIEDMFEMAQDAERLGFDSVWAGDSLLEKPRFKPIPCLSKLAGLTDEVTLGAACMITPLYNPIQLAQSWATLDAISGGRTVMGACMAAAADERGRKQYEVVGIPPEKRPVVLREGIEVMKRLWDDRSVTYDGEYYQFEDVTFDIGNERTFLEPAQDDVPVWVVSNPSARGRDAIHDPAVRRIVDVGDGWMTCCRADHPDEYGAQLDAIHTAAEEAGRDPDEIATSYQITAHIAGSEREAERNMNEYIGEYYPKEYYDIEDWGPMGSPDDVIEWIETFADLGVETFILRFGAFDQREQLRRFAEDVMPSF